MIGKEDDGASQVALVVKNCLPMHGTLEMWVRSLGGTTPWRRTCNPLRYSCLENPKDRGAWQAIVQRVAQSWTRLK